MADEDASNSGKKFAPAESNLDRNLDMDGGEFTYYFDLIEAQMRNPPPDNSNRHPVSLHYTPNTPSRSSTAVDVVLPSTPFASAAPENKAIDPALLSRIPAASDGKVEISAPYLTPRSSPTPISRLGAQKNRKRKADELQSKDNAPSLKRRRLKRPDASEASTVPHASKSSKENRLKMAMRGDVLEAIANGSSIAGQLKRSYDTIFRGRTRDDGHGID